MTEIERILEELTPVTLATLPYPVGHLLKDLVGTDLEDLLKPLSQEEKEISTKHTPNKV